MIGSFGTRYTMASPFSRCPHPSVKAMNASSLIKSSSSLNPGIVRKASRMTVAPRAEGEGGSGSGAGSPGNSGGLGDLFKRNNSKQDAAKKALQDAFSGKKDPFALDEERRKRQGGGGNRGSGGGGGGGDGGGFNFGDFSDGFRKWLRSTLRALAATFLFLAAILTMYLWKPMLEFLTTVIRVLLRLDGNPRAQMSAQQLATPDFSKADGLGNVEESVIAKWGADANDAIEDDDEDDVYDDEDEYDDDSE